MRIIIKFLLFISLISIFGCGYEPLYSSKGQNFAIGNISYSGDKKLKNVFVSKLKKFKKDDESSYDLEINIQRSINVISKDKKGKPSIFNLAISVSIDYKQNGEIKKSKTFSQSTNYNNQDNKFDLKNEEKVLEKQLLDKIFENFLFFTQSI